MFSPRQATVGYSLVTLSVNLKPRAQAHESPATTSATGSHGNSKSGAYLRTIVKLRIDALLKTKVSRLERYETVRTPATSPGQQLIAGVARAIDDEQFFPNPSWR